MNYYFFVNYFTLNIREPSFITIFSKDSRVISEKSAVSWLYKVIGNQYLIPVFLLSDRLKFCLSFIEFKFSDSCYSFRSIS
jgi:hypothetical protein